jgi:hypothetical protein
VDLIRGYPVTVNNTDFAGFVLDTARELIGPEAVHAASHPIMASEILVRAPEGARRDREFEHAPGG